MSVDTLMPTPGQGVSGLVMMSKGLPGIKRCVVQPNIEEGDLYPSVEEVDNPDSLLAKIKQDREVVKFLGFTIGPYSPHATFNGLNLLDTIKSYINQSRSLGWITNQTTANKYLGFIDSARSNLQANNRGVAKAKLDAVLVNANADSATTLTSEAYALLRFNTEYVMKKLREEDSVFAAENKSSSADATATNNARHLAKSENYLHEVFTSGGEIYYRRSADGGSTWDQTHRVNTAFGDNSRPCIVTAATSSIHIVWQRKIAASRYEVWHAYSQDNGETWSTPTTLPEADQVEVSGYQTDGTMPVIAEMSGSNALVVVNCSNEGLRYRISEDDGGNWQVPDQDIIGGEGWAQNDRVRFPTLADVSVVGSSYVSLLYDYVDDDYGPYSRIFDGGGWSGETSVGTGTGAVSGAFSSVAVDVSPKIIAAWSGIANTWTRSIIFRLGYHDNTWSNWFAEFGSGQLGPDWVYPSLAYYPPEGGQYGVAILNHTSWNQIKLIRYVDGQWEISILGESDAWASITQQNPSSFPFYGWTDQSTFPYEITVGSLSELSPLRGRTPSKSGAMKLTNVGVTQKRRAVVYHRNLRATLSLEFERMKIVNVNGDTSVVPFKTSPTLSGRDRDTINFLNMWDYLGSAVVSVPANARRLVVSKQFALRGPSIAQRKFFLRVVNTNGIPLGVLDTTSTSGTISVNIAPYAGRDVILRPQVELIGIIPSSVKIGAGDVFIVPDTQSKPVRQKKNKGGKL